MSRPTVTAELVEGLWQAVADGDEHRAAEVVHEALAEGVDEETLLVDVVAVVQRKVGAEWAANRITVAQEHTATAINERITASMAHRRHRDGRRDAPPRGRVTVSCVDGEWHAFPARLVAEVLSLRGWRVDYLGAQTPTPHLVAHLHHTNPDAVLLSGSIPTHLPAAHAAITACQSVGVPVVVGGRAFGPDGRYARTLCADRWAADARGAVAVLEEGVARPDASVSRQAVDDLPHLVDQEYTMVVQSRPRLVKQTLIDLENRYPAMSGYSDAQRERTAEDIAHIVDFLATALYVNDADLFTTFLTWSADILEARHVPAHSMVMGLDVLADQLRDFPRAVALLHESSAALSERSVRPVPGPDTRA
ncbi:cobalamin B12-binding domain-containing protein [Streptomyces chromofuscus]|uniref:cobalamin B12-binding domain-containing protein n=1 Tax=Streptomyces chromofuscus TaxID=42881 RepID=UPI001678AC2E|nr:cobalamin-dependent protein [Streptomyces chromofuscus]GGT15642.1 cobalamin-binding protein [Streptomyces chromofuscus]